ncbi:hypothetical protein Bpfe_023105 [Biomphalaria pfeifferi]|uniref:Uncharacterized protein n=1 Tax=Biomphalaria pfeifferi TaxID=112525 RepID=A0AAD8B3M4_BIOPF|nr:hypothetical protein Bpfe_023105 [Biomphalaria pfeifferi]
MLAISSEAMLAIPGETMLAIPGEAMLAIPSEEMLVIPSEAMELSNYKLHLIMMVITCVRITKEERSVKGEKRDAVQCKNKVNQVHFGDGRNRKYLKHDLLSVELARI